MNIGDKVKYIKFLRIPMPFEFDAIYTVSRISMDNLLIVLEEFPGLSFLKDNFELC